MPSPFPGMDPFLEDPEIFPDLHDRLITYLSEALQSQLPEPYYTIIGRRVWLEVSRRYIGPDVQVLRPGAIPDRSRENGGGVAVASPPASRAVVVRIPHDERTEPFLEIYAGSRENKRLVTAIEILSPTNKTPGEHGRDLYLRKQRAILESKAHLVEIDLLRAGEHTTAVPQDRAMEAAGAFDYHVCVHRFDNLEDYLVYPVRLQDRLPAIAIPLLPGDPEVVVDLQSVFNRCYDLGPYHREIQYGEDTPAPPLEHDQEEWVRARLGQARPGFPESTVVHQEST